MTRGARTHDRAETGTEATKRALASLAAGERVDPAAAVAEAETALADVRDAAAFVADGGVGRVRRAVAAAESPEGTERRRGRDAASSDAGRERGTTLRDGDQ